MVQSVANDHARLGCASDIGISMVSGGIGKNELSANEIVPISHSAYGLSAAAMHQSYALRIMPVLSGEVTESLPAAPAWARIDMSGFLERLRHVHAPDTRRSCRSSHGRSRQGGLMGASTCIPAIGSRIGPTFQAACDRDHPGQKHSQERDDHGQTDFTCLQALAFPLQEQCERQPPN